MSMQHEIDHLRRTLEMYEEEQGEDRDERAIICIKNALKEMSKYYKNGIIRLNDNE